MKVCIDLTSLADNFSGIERFAACLTREMIEDESIEFILLFKNNIHPIFANTKKNVETVIIPGCRKLWFNQVRLPRTINQIDADFYLFLAFPVPVLLFKKNMISAIHDICCWDCPETMNGLSKWYFRISHKIAIKKCKAIITISEFSKQRIVDKLKFDEDKIWLVYCGVDEKFINYKKSETWDESVRVKYNLPNEYILSLSTLEPRKNIGLLIEAYSQLVTNENFDIPLVLAGRKGWKMDEVLSTIDIKVKDRIIFTGFIDDNDLPAVYGNAKLFVFPSLYEGFGMPPLEALACGTKVLSSDSTSLPEVLGNCAHYFRNNNVNELKEQIKSCMVDYFSNEKQIKEWVNHYNWNRESNRIREKLK